MEPINKPRNTHVVLRITGIVITSIALCLASHAHLSQACGVMSSCYTHQHDGSGETDVYPCEQFCDTNSAIEIVLILLLASYLVLSIAFGLSLLKEGWRTANGLNRTEAVFHALATAGLIAGGILTIYGAFMYNWRNLEGIHWNEEDRSVVKRNRAELFAAAGLTIMTAALSGTLSRYLFRRK